MPQPTKKVRWPDRQLSPSLRATGLPQSSTVRIADLASAMRRAGKPVLDFSAGRAAEATDDAICDAAIAALRAGDTHQTPARGTPAYLAACAAKLKTANGLDLDPDAEVIATMGCKQGLVLSLMATLDPGDEVIVEDPCFVSYAPTIELCGGVPVAATLSRDNGYRWSREDLGAALTDRTKAILYCSPHNPLGVVHTLEDLAVIADVATERGLFVIADEIYEAVTWHDRRHTPIATLPGMRDHAIGLMGMTKSYSMGGWRIGYAYASADVISTMVVLQQHLMTCASSIAQAAGAAALSPEITAKMAPLWQDWQARCDFVAEELDAHPALGVRPPEGGFYAWIDIGGTGLTSQAFTEALLAEKSMTVVPGGTFGASTDRFIRMTAVKSWDDIREGVARMKAFADAL